MAPVYHAPPPSGNIVAFPSTRRIGPGKADPVAADPAAVWRGYTRALAPWFAEMTRDAIMAKARAGHLEPAIVEALLLGNGIGGAQ